MKTNESKEDRRRYKRISLALPLSYRNLVYAKENFLGGYTKNICAGGAKFAVTRFIPEETKIKMTITLKENQPPVDVTSRIVWISKMPYNDIYHLGVEFVNITGEDKNRILDYIYSSAY